MLNFRLKMINNINNNSKNKNRSNIRIKMNIKSINLMRYSSSSKKTLEKTLY